MGHKSRHIERKNDWWHYRRRVPTDLRIFIPQKEIKSTLKTQSQKQAEYLARCKNAKVEEVFVLLRSGILDDVQVAKVVEQLNPQLRPLVSLEEVLNKYLVDKRASLGVRTFSEYEIRAKSVQKYLKNRSINAISRTDIVALRDKLSKSLSPATVNKYISWLKTFFGWCVIAGYLAVNPALGVSQLKDTGKRDRYDLAELKRMVDLISPFHNSSEYPERYWVPFICLYMGLRLTEALQLLSSDVQKIDGVWCININSSAGRSLKTASSERIVPIHPMLVQLGLLIYIEGRKDWLWPSVVGKGGKSGRISNGFACWYGQQVNPKVTFDGRKSFHSLRHSFVDVLKQSGIEEQVIAELVGHSRGSITMERYGKKYLPQVLLQSMNKLEYPGLFS